MRKKKSLAAKVETLEEWEAKTRDEMSELLGSEGGRLFVDALVVLSRLDIPEPAIDVCLAMIVCHTQGWDFDEYTEGKDYRSPTAVDGHVDKVRGKKRLEQLRRRLDRVEPLPENEAVRFQLETEIYRLEYAQPEDEWPEFVGEEGAR